MLADGCLSPYLHRHLTTAAIPPETGQTLPLPRPNGPSLSQRLRLSAPSRARHPSLLRGLRKAPTGSGVQAGRGTLTEGEKEESQTHEETRGSEGRERVAGSEQRTEDWGTGPGPEAGEDGRLKPPPPPRHKSRDALEAQRWAVATRGVTGGRGEGA